MLFLNQNGFRTIAHDRRGHGRSTQTSSGNDMDTYADDLETLFEALDLHSITMVGHSTGGGEVARYIGRHGTRRVAAAVLISAVPPIMGRSPSNPEGLPIELFDGFRAGLARNRGQLYREFAALFYGTNRPGTNVPQPVLDQLWRLCMQTGLKNSYECVKAFSETDFREDLKKFDVPTLVVHGEDDQVVPIDITGRKTAELVKGAQAIFYPAAPHGITETHQDQLNADLLKFLRRSPENQGRRERMTAAAAR
jgi:non-heme chloroperoxidase